MRFFFKPEINQEVLDRLCKKLVLRSYNNGTYDIHDLIKSYFLDRMTDYEKQEYISIACDHYSSSGSEKDLLDYLRLLSESQQRKRFIRAVLENADFLLSQGYSQVGEYIQDIDEAEVSKLDYVRLLILKCDAALANGKHQLARRFLKKGLASYDSLLQTKLKEKTKEELILLVSRIYNRSAEISKLEGRLDETIKEHKKSIQLNKKYNNKPGEGKALNNLALAYRERGELDLALDTLMKAQKIFQELNDKTALALVEVNIGDIYLLKRDLKAAMNHFQQAENASLKYPATRGLIFNKIGKAQVQLGHFDLAQNAYFVSLKAYKEANDQTNRIRTLSELFKCALNLKNREAAQNYLEATLRLLEDRFRPPEPSDSSELTLKNTLFSRHMKDRLIFSSIWDKKELKTNLKEYVNFQLNNNDPKAILEDLDYLLKELDTQKRALLILCADLER